MAPLVLKYTGPSGERASVAVEKERFLIGRHTSCDLSISDSRLSREHLLIEKIGDSFVAIERGSSNGTELNGEAMFDPRALSNNDRLSLGGFEIKVEIKNADLAEEPVPPPAVEAEAPIARPAQAAAAQPATSDGFSTKSIVIVTVLAVGILAALGIFVFMSIGGKRKVDNSNFVYSSDPTDTPQNRKTPEPGASTSPGSTTPSNGVNAATPENTTPIPTPANLPDGGKAEFNAASFMRKIAQNDPKAFVTGEQARIIDGKIKSIGGSPALADNFASARKNAAAIKSLAESKGLKPQFLAVAAITLLGGSHGDVLQTSQKMAETMEKFRAQIGNGLADECLLMIAGYDQGDPMKMRNMLQNLATTAIETPRTIRTIWYLKKVGKITDGEYDFALRFLATGAIAQNPKDFGVNTEGLNF